MLPPLAISAGDPAGVGPVVTAAALAQCLGSDRALVYGDAGWMERALRRYGFQSLRRMETAEAGTLTPGEVGLVHVADWPITYDDLEPYYSKVEWDMGVSGAPGHSDPPRSRPFPMPPLPI